MSKDDYTLQITPFVLSSTGEGDELSAGVHKKSAVPVVCIPGSKSHTIRALFLAGLAKGTSTIHNYLDSGDTRSCIGVLETLGARVDYISENCLQVHSEGMEMFRKPKPVIKNADNGESILEDRFADDCIGGLCRPIDLGNSGTSLYFATALAALSSTPIFFTGDDSLCTRSALPLLEALESLGATIYYDVQDSVGNNFDMTSEAFSNTKSDDSSKKNTRIHARGCLPYGVVGPISIPDEGKERSVYIECSTSQYLSALIMLLSVSPGPSVIEAKLVGEFPYVDMTLAWLARQGMTIEHDEAYKHFSIAGSGNVDAFDVHIPGDYSSATFFIAIAALSGRAMRLRGLEIDHTQSDMKVLDIVSQMGCRYEWQKDEIAGTGIAGVEDSGAKDGIDAGKMPLLYIERTEPLKGIECDLSENPDSLPMIAVLAAYANSPSRLYNVAHARKKETDRIALMCQELAKLGVRTVEFDDGLEIHPTKPIIGLAGGEVHSHHDHRISMAFAAGAVGAATPVIIHNADAAEITFPNFFEELKKTGVEIRRLN